MGAVTVTIRRRLRTPHIGMKASIIGSGMYSDLPALLGYSERVAPPFGSSRRQKIRRIGFIGKYRLTLERTGQREGRIESTRCELNLVNGGARCPTVSPFDPGPTRKPSAWYDGSNYRWSTDYTRQVLFKKKTDAKLICDELRSLCPRNAKVINIEPEQVGPSLDLLRADLLEGSKTAWRNRRFPVAAVAHSPAATAAPVSRGQFPVAGSNPPPSSSLSGSSLGHHSDQFRVS